MQSADAGGSCPLDLRSGSETEASEFPGYVRFTPQQRTDAPQQTASPSTIFDRAEASFREIELSVCFRDSAGWPKKRALPAIFRSSFKNRQLHLRHRISVSDRLLFGWNLKSSAALPQHYRQSRVHLSLQIDQEATEMEKCDEEISIGYRWFNSIRHSRSCVGR
jgi:hypothetical protein